MYVTIVCHSQLLLLLVVCVSRIYGTCPGGVVLCDWASWGDWSDCLDTCGTTEMTLRSRGLCCQSVWSLDQCKQVCGRDDSGFVEETDCGRICYNGGTFDIDCQCHDRFYGSCCENRELKC